MMPSGRARTPEQKRAVIERLYALWLTSPHQRLGQLLVNAAHEGPPTPLFNVEDDALVELIETFVAKGSARR